MIDLQNTGGLKIIELGGGDNPHPASTVNVDVRQGPKVHFTCDFNRDGDWPEIGSNDADVVVSFFCLEHISYRLVPNFLKNVFRILKPGGRVVFTIPNFEMQFKWTVEHPEGWDGKDLFTAASELFFGTQDYAENSHRCFFTPGIIAKLFTDAGFANPEALPYNERSTDLCVKAVKPISAVQSMDPASTSGYAPFWKDNAKPGYAPEHIEAANEPPSGGRPNHVVLTPVAQPAVCGKPGPRGLVCTRPAGHEGKHSCEVPA